MFNVERGLSCSPRLCLFDQKYSKNSEILLELKTAVSMWICVKL